VVLTAQKKTRESQPQSKKQHEHLIVACCRSDGLYAM